MIRFSRKTRGVITVFLVLILVPTLVVSAILVDGSRMVSARTISQEASDLAALSVLSDYHTTLKEDYGLFAINDKDKVQDMFQECLKATLQSSGLSEESYSEQVWGALKGALGAPNSYKGKTFLNLYDFQLEQLSVTPLFTLANKDVLQNQIVEYSKYRGLYVISERLGLLNQISGIASEAKEQEKAADVIEDKMDVDQKNAKADAVLAQAKKWIEEINGKLSGTDSQKDQYFSYLSDYMAVQAGVEDLSNSTKENAENYPEVAEATIQYFKELDHAVEELKNILPDAKAKTEQAIHNLEGFISENSSSSNSAVQDLLQDARKDSNMYQKCLQDLQELENNGVYQILCGNKIGDLAGSVIGRCKTAVDQYAGEMDEEEEEGTYKFYYYNLSSTTEESGEALQNYRQGWNANIPIDSSSSIPNVSTGNDNCGWGQAPNQNMKDKAKAQSGRSSEVEDTNYQKAQGSIENSVYNALPSKTFNPSAEAQSYGGEVAGEMVSIPEDSAPSMDLNFYNESGNLNAAKSIVGKGKSNFLSKLENMAEISRDEVLTLSYIFGNFKTRMTGNEKFKKGAISESEMDKFYIVPWRYLYEDGEQDMRFSAKSKRNTKLRSEIEYLIYGQRTDAGNEAAVYATIFAPRMANNMIALYQNTNVKATCQAAAIAASAATFGTVPPTVFFWIFLTAWSIAETIMDMSYLISDGYRIPLIKTKDNILLEFDLNAVKSGNLIENYKPSSGSDHNIYVCYEDYLLFLLLLKGSNTRLMRTADLIELNVQLSDADFQIDQAYTYLRAESELSIRYLFIDTAPFAQEYTKANLKGRLKFHSTIYQGY